MLDKLFVQCYKCGKTIPKFKRCRVVVECVFIKERVIKENCCKECVVEIFEGFKKCL